MTDAPEMMWSDDMEAAPKDRYIVVYYDHDAFPYYEYSEDVGGCITDKDWFDFCEMYPLEGKGLAIVSWKAEEWEEDPHGECNGGYYVPACWFVTFDFESGHSYAVCRPTHWRLLDFPTPLKE